jgi:lysophospholipase L1-like esterase
MIETAKMPDLPLWKQILFGFVMIVGLTIILILGVEGVGLAIIHLKYGVPGKSYGLWQYDRELGAIHAVNAYNTNSETNNFGFRNKENVVEPKPANALRIIAYGGSTTYCYNLPNDLAWPVRLQQILRAQHNASDQVLNGGAIMWSIGHELARAKRDLPKLTPDVVIIYSGLNEEANAALLKAEGVSLEQALKDGKIGLFSRSLDQARWMKRNSVIVRYWDYVAASWWHSLNAGGAETHIALPQTQPGSGAIDPVVSQNFNATLRDFITLIRAQGAKPIYVVVGGLPEIGVNGRLLQYSRQVRRSRANST